MPTHKDLLSPLDKQIPDERDDFDPVTSWRLASQPSYEITKTGSKSYRSGGSPYSTRRHNSRGVDAQLLRGDNSWKRRQVGSGNGDEKPGPSDLLESIDRHLSFFDGEISPVERSVAGKDTVEAPTRSKGNTGRSSPEIFDCIPSRSNESGSFSGRLDDYAGPRDSPPASSISSSSASGVSHNENSPYPHSHSLGKIPSKDMMGLSNGHILKEPAPTRYEPSLQRPDSCHPEVSQNEVGRALSPRNYGDSEYISPPSSLDNCSTGEESTLCTTEDKYARKKSDSSKKPTADDGPLEQLNAALESSERLRQRERRLRKRERHITLLQQRRQSQQFKDSPGHKSTDSGVSEHWRQQDSDSEDGIGEDGTVETSQHKADSPVLPESSSEQKKRSLRNAPVRLQERRFKGANAKLNKYLVVPTEDIQLQGSGLRSISPQRSALSESPQFSVQSSPQKSLFDDSDSFAESTVTDAFSGVSPRSNGPTLLKIDEDEDVVDVFYLLDDDIEGQGEIDDPKHSVTSPPRRRTIALSNRRAAIVSSMRQRRECITKSTSSESSSSLSGIVEVGYEKERTLNRLVRSNDSGERRRRGSTSGESNGHLPLSHSLDNRSSSVANARDGATGNECRQYPRLWSNGGTNESVTPQGRDSEVYNVTGNRQLMMGSDPPVQPVKAENAVLREASMRGKDNQSTSGGESHINKLETTLVDDAGYFDTDGFYSFDGMGSLKSSEKPRTGGHVFGTPQSGESADREDTPDSSKENASCNQSRQRNRIDDIQPLQTLECPDHRGYINKKNDDQRLTTVNTRRGIGQVQSLSSPAGAPAVIPRQQTVPTPSSNYNLKAFEFDEDIVDSPSSLFEEKLEGSPSSLFEEKLGDSPSSLYEEKLEDLSRSLGSPETDESTFTESPRSRENAENIDFDAMTKQAGAAVSELRNIFTSFMCASPASKATRTRKKAPSMFNSSYVCAPNQGSVAKKEWNKSVKESMNILAQEYDSEPFSPSGSKKGVCFNDEEDKSALLVRRAKRMLEGKKLRACPSNQLIDKEFVNMMRDCDGKELSAIVSSICNDKNEKFRTVVFSQHDPSIRNKIFKLLTTDRLDDLDEYAKVALVKVLAIDNNHNEVEDFMSRLWISVSQTSRADSEREIGLHAAAWARRCCVGNLDAFPRSLWRRPGNKDRKCLVADDIAGLPSRVREEGEAAIDAIAETVLSYFPNEGSGALLVGSTIVDELIVELGLSSINEDIDWQDANEKYPDVSTFVREVAHNMKQNPIFLTFGAAWHMTDEFAMQQYGPKRTDHMEADVRFAVAYCFLHYLICSAYLLSPRACDCYEGDGENDHETIMASEQRSFLDKLLYAVDVKVREERLRSHNWEGSLFEKNRMDLILRYMLTFAQPMKAGGSIAKETVREQKFQTTIPFIILETMCENVMYGIDSNAFAGFELMMEHPGSRGSRECDRALGSGDAKEWTTKHSSKETTRSGVLLYKTPYSKVWNNLFDAWNMASCSIYPDAIDHFAPLLAPVLCHMRTHEKDGLFLSARFLCMHLHMHYLMCARTNLNSSSTTSTDFRNDVATLLLGLVNRSAAEQYKKLVETTIEEEGGTAFIWKHEGKRLGLQSLWATLKVAVVGVQGAQSVPDDALRLFSRLHDMFGEWGEELGVV